MATEPDSNDPANISQVEPLGQPIREVAPHDLLVQASFLPGHKTNVRRIPRVEPFYERVEALKSGDILVTFDDGREMRGYRARLVVIMGSRVSRTSALPKEELFQSVYQEPSRGDDSKLDLLIFATNPIIEKYQRRITSTGLTPKEKRAGLRTNYYLQDLQRKSFYPHEIRPTRLAAIALLTEELPSMNAIIQTLGPSEKMGGKLLRPQNAAFALREQLRYLYMRVTPSSNWGPANPAEAELIVWLGLRHALQEDDNLLLYKKLIEKVEAIRVTEKEGRKINNSNKDESQESEPLTSYDKAVLAVWAQEQRPLIESLNYPLIPEQLIIDLILEDVDTAIEQPVESNVVTLEQVQQDRNTALNRILKVVRSGSFSDTHQIQSQTSQDLLEYFWVLDDETKGLETIFR